MKRPEEIVENRNVCVCACVRVCACACVCARKLDGDWHYIVQWRLKTGRGIGRK